MKKIAIIPIYDYITDALLVDECARDYMNEPMIKTKELFAQEGYLIEIYQEKNFEEYEHFIFYNYNKVTLLKKLAKAGKINKTIYVSLEPPVVDKMHKPINMQILAKSFGGVLTWQDDLVDNKSFSKINIPMPYYRKIEPLSFSDKKLLTMINGQKHKSFYKQPSNLYAKRVELTKWYELNHPEDYDLYGMGWDKKRFPSYLGKVDNKNIVMSKYKFAVCYENMENINGYVTEKIFDCMYSGCVPIYRGATNIGCYIDSKCYIDDSKYKSYEELYEFLNCMTEQQHKEYIENIEKYLKSEQYKQFLPDNYFSQIKQGLIMAKNNVCNEIENANNISNLKRKINIIKALTFPYRAIQKAKRVLFGKYLKG